MSDYQEVQAADLLYHNDVGEISGGSATLVRELVQEYNSCWS